MTERVDATPACERCDIERLAAVDAGASEERSRRRDLRARSTRSTRHSLTAAERNLVGWYLTQKYAPPTSCVEP